MKRSTDSVVQGHQPVSPLSVFCAAAPADQALLAHWETTLLPLIEHAHVISCWSEQHADPGANVEQERRHHLDQADVILLLLSPDFFASQMCLDVMQRALQRLHDKTAQVIPLLLRPVHWHATELGTLAPLPANGIPVTQWESEDEAWHACVLGLQPMLRRRLFAALPAFPSARAQRRAATDRERVLGRLRKTYQALLDHSLQGITWMEVGLANKPGAVRTASSLLMRLPEHSEQILPPGTSMLHVFDEAQEELLILGAPGAGKSTLLLDLALHLVERADTDETHPLPVILPLSSWAVQQSPLDTWMIEQFARTYDVPRLLSTRWVGDRHILPLLDGLDEMEESARSACIAAINRYHREHLTPLVVCSRRAEYEAAATKERLALQSAVVVQPLTAEQIDASLQAAGPAFVGLHMALSQQSDLRELATTPLMLSILLLTYQGASQEAMLQSSTDLEQQVWTDYVARMVLRKGNETHYPLEQTRHWLTWLAQQMRTHQQTIFSAEYLQDDWLAHDQQRTVHWLTVRLPALVLGCLASLLVLHFVRGDADHTSQLQVLLLGGFVGDCLSKMTNTKTTLIGPHSPALKRSQLIRSILLGALLAASFGLSLHQPRPRPSDPDYSLSFWMRDGCIFWIGSGLSVWFFQVLLFRRPSLQVPSSSPRTSLSAWFVTMAPQHVWQATLVWGTGIGLSLGLIYGRAGLIEGLGVELGAELIAIASVLLTHVILAGSIEPLRFAERISWTWRHLLRPEHLRTSVIVAGTLFIFFGLLYCLISGVSYGLSYGFSYGASYGVSVGLSAGLISGVSYGLSYGFSYGLSYWLLLGLYQGMVQEHVEDQDRHSFNQGIRRSLRNGILLSLASASILGGIGVLSYGLTVGLISELSSVLSFGLSSTLISELVSRLSYGRGFGLISACMLLISGFLLTWAMSGGLTILRHYVIRCFLARSHRFPWRAQAFLDDATARILLQRVGGGYRFIHRRLLDYFADMDTTATSPAATPSVPTSTH